MKDIIFVTGTIRSQTSWPFLLAKGLSERGLNVTVISGYANINVSDEYRNHQLANPVELLSPSFEIRRVGSRKKDPQSLVGRALKYVKLTIDIAKELNKSEADLYLLYSTPPFLGLLGRRLTRKGNKTIYIAQDLFPDNLFAVKPAIQRSVIGGLLRRIEHQIYDSNTHIITVSETMKRTIEKNSSSTPIDVIYNWANIDELHHVNRIDNSLFDEYCIDRNKFIVSYAGSLGPLQNIDLLLDVARRFKDNRDVEFVIFGRGVNQVLLEKRIRNEMMTNVKLLPIQSSEKISEVYSLGDLEYVSVGEGVMNMACPHKILDIFTVGSAILAVIDMDCDMARIISDNELGIVASSVDEIEMGINELLYKRTRIAVMGSNSRQFAEKVDYKKQIAKYIRVIEDC